MNEHAMPAEHNTEAQSSSVDYDHLLQQAQETTPYTTAETATIAFESFRFSQGDVLLQARIIDYIASRAGSRLSREMLEEAVSRVNKRATAFVSTEQLHHRTR